MSDTPLRLLVESVYQPTDARRDAVLAHDWSDLPRIARALDALPRPVTNVALSDAAWNLVHEAAEALEAHFPPMPGTVTPLEVVRLHVLERQPWPSLEAQMREEGRPVSRGTLIRRQHEFLSYFAEWARRGDTVEAAAPASDADQTPVASTRTLAAPRRTRGFTAIAVLLLLVAVWAGATLGPSNPTTSAEVGPRKIARERIGRQVFGDHRPGDVLPAPWPAFQLPDWETDRLTCMILESDDGRPRMFLTWLDDATGAIRFRAWDPQTEAIVWESAFDPPRDERLTHATLEDAARFESYRPTRLYHASRAGDLGDWAVVVMIQKYSPTFVVFVHVGTGEVGGYYLHPGQFASGHVYDFDGDGRGELALGGTDNAVNLPVVVVLQPGRWTGVASTVSWNESAVEGARRRVLLPDWETGRKAISAPRLSATDLVDISYDAHHDVLTIGVGLEASPLFRVRVDGRLDLRPEMPFLLWDSDRIHLAELGLDPPDFTGWEERVITIEGIDRRAGDESR